MSGFEEAPARYEAVTPDLLIGAYKRIGHFGPAYEVLRILSRDEAVIVLIETGEELAYPIQDILTDPDPDAAVPTLS